LGLGARLCGTAQSVQGCLPGVVREGELVAKKHGFYRGNPITNHEKNETNIGFYREFQLLNMF